MKKRISALILCLALCLTLPQPAFAGAGENAWTEEETSMIETEEVTEAFETEEETVPVDTEAETVTVETDELAAETESAEDLSKIKAAGNPEEVPKGDKPEAAKPGPDAEIKAASGSCGDNVTWTLDDNGVLTLSGSGATWGFTNEYPSFFAHSSECKSVVIESGITELGDHLFYRMTNITSVSLPYTLKIIGDSAFSVATGLTSVTIPGDVTKIGFYAFNNCSSLTDVHFLGDPPATINGSAFTNTTTTAYYYPVPAWTSDKLQNYGGTLTWVKDDKCGADLTWKLDAAGKLTISGSGAMTDFEHLKAPWNAFRERIETLSLPSGLTSIGNFAFYFCYNMTF